MQQSGELEPHLSVSTSVYSPLLLPERVLLAFCSCKPTLLQGMGVNVYDTHRCPIIDLLQDTYSRLILKTLE